MTHILPWRDLSTFGINQLDFRQLNFVTGRADEVGRRVSLDRQRRRQSRRLRCRRCRWSRRCRRCSGPLVAVLQRVAQDAQDGGVLVVQLPQEVPQQIPDSLAAAVVVSPKPLVAARTQESHAHCTISYWKLEPICIFVQSENSHWLQCLLFKMCLSIGIACLIFCISTGIFEKSIHDSFDGNYYIKR